MTGLGMALFNGHVLALTVLKVKLRKILNLVECRKSQKSKLLYKHGTKTNIVF